MSDAVDLDGVAAPRALERTLARGVFVVGAFAALAGIARVLQDSAIAWRYGTGSVVDAYYFLASLANWPVAVALSALTLLVAPLEAARQGPGRSGEVQRFRRELLGAVLLLALASLPLAWWMLQAIAGGGLGGLERQAAALAVAEVPAIVAVVPLGLAGALLSAWLVAAGRHILSLIEALPPLVVIAAVLLVPGHALFWATAAGMALQVAGMAGVLCAARALPVPAVGFASSAWHGVALGVVLLVAAQVVSAVPPLVDAFFAARLGEGTLATLNFANRLVLGLQGLAGLALQRAALPLLSRMMVGSPGDAERAVLQWAGLMAATGVVTAFLVAMAADPLVALLFERGRFGAADREQVATLLRWGLLQLIPYFAGVPVVTALASTGASGLLALAALLGLAAKIAVSALLLGGYGAVGLQVATAVMYTVAAITAGAALRRRLRRGINQREA